MNFRPVESWGRLPEGWSYVEATSVAVGPNDDVYVFNRGAKPVMVFNSDGKTFNSFFRRWLFWNCPRFKNAIHLKAKIIVKMRRCVFLDDEAGRTRFSFFNERRIWFRRFFRARKFSFFVIL